MSADGPRGRMPGAETGGERGREAVVVPRSVGALVEQLAAILQERGLYESRLAIAEARELVAALYDVPRFWPVTNSHVPVEMEMWPRARAAAAKRAGGAPLAYAVGRAAFRHLTLDVDERVLIPRPETELLVDLVLERVGGPGGIAVDVGTGSGALALALACEGQFEHVVGTDVSEDALTVARANARMLGARGALRAPVSLLLGSVLAPVRALPLRARTVVANPPYIAYDEARELPRDVRDWEPPIALFSGGQGLTVSAEIIRDAADVLEPMGLLAVEVDARRASLVAELVAGDARYANVSVHLDLAGRERFVLAHRR